MESKDTKQIENISREEPRGEINFISIGDISVHSTNENLKTVEKTICKLLDKYSNFLLCRREFKIKTADR